MTDYQAAYEHERKERGLLEMKIAQAVRILDPENRFETLEEAAKARMEQIVKLEGLR